MNIYEKKITNNIRAEEKKRFGIILTNEEERSQTGRKGFLYTDKNEQILNTQETEHDIERY